MTRLYQKELSDPLGEFRARADVTVMQATESDLERVTELAVKWRPWMDPMAAHELYRDRIRRGARCFVAKIDDQVVHYNWVIFDRAESWPDLQGVNVLREGEAYCAEGYTAEGWRGQGIHPAVLSRMLLFLRDTGYKTAYTAVDAVHRDSWITHQRLGWELSGLAISFRRRKSDKMRVWGMAWGPRVRHAGRAMGGVRRSDGS